MLSPEHRKRAESIYRYLRRWFDPRSYRPLILLFVVAMAVFLGPLATEVATALFYRIPNALRKAMVHGLLLSFLGLAFYRLWQVKPADSWPSEEALGLNSVPAPGAAGWPGR